MNSMLQMEVSGAQNGNSVLNYVFSGLEHY